MFESWEDFPTIGRDIFEAMRSNSGETMVLKKNFFVERVLPASILRELDEEEKTIYNQRYTAEGKSEDVDLDDIRLPTLKWPRQMPIRNDTSPCKDDDDAITIIDKYNAFFRQKESMAATIPKM